MSTLGWIVIVVVGGIVLAGVVWLGWIGVVGGIVLAGVVWFMRAEQRARDGHMDVVQSRRKEIEAKPNFLHFEDLYSTDPFYPNKGVSYYAIADSHLFWGDDPDHEKSVKLASIRAIEVESLSDRELNRYWGEITLVVDNFAQPRRSFEIRSREAGDELSARVQIAIDRQRVAR